MTTLDVAGNRISTLDGLDGLTKIEELWVSMMIIRRRGKLFLVLTSENQILIHGCLIHLACFIWSPKSLLLTRPMLNSADLTSH